jgi:hypothetical protein
VFVRFATEISPPLHFLSSGEMARMRIEHIRHDDLLSEIASHKAPHFCNAQDLISCADKFESLEAVVAWD